MLVKRLSAESVRLWVLSKTIVRQYKTNVRQEISVVEAIFRRRNICFSQIGWQITTNKTFGDRVPSAVDTFHEVTRRHIELASG